MTQITSNFKLSEFTHSNTAIARKIDNIPDEYAVNNINNLVKYLLQPLRDIYNKPMGVNSGYRSKELNKAVGGVPTSQHLVGKASDIRCKNPLELLRTLIQSNLEFDQAILYPTFLHLSYNKGANRNQILYNKSYKGEKA